MKHRALLVLLLALAGCKPRPLTQTTDLIQLIEEGDEFAELRADVAHFYTTSNYQPVWVRNGEPTRRAREIVEVLKHAGDKGLDSDDYSTATLNPQDPAKFDLSLTVGLMRYLDDVGGGKANPGLYGEVSRDRQVAVRGVLEATDLAEYVQHIEPPFEDYKRLLAALPRYRALAREDDGELLPETKKPVEPGSDYAGVPRLVHLLQCLGDLEPGEEPGSYRGVLVEAVKRFQKRNGLDSDGRLGKATLAALNKPMTARVRQIELTLERWRWIPHDFKNPPIIVNVPEFELRAYDGSLHPVLQMRVIAGQAPEHDTPLFAGEMQYVIFRPYWNVPVSIQQKELVPQIRKDRSYLAKHDYEVTTQQGQVVSQGPVSDEILARLQSGKLAVRQVPGAQNSLGYVKFVFPNENDVYLHDTPSRSLFQIAKRDLSHGCIRVEKPADLAAWVLRAQPGWSRERITAAMNGATQQVNLNQRIPVLLVYQTAATDESGNVGFFADVYGNDAALQAQLAKRRASPRITSDARVPHPRG